MMTDSPEASPRACICCGGALATAENLAPLLRCAACGHVCADLELSDEEMHALYSEQYFKGAEYLDYEREAPALRRNFQRNLRRLRQRHPGGGRLWEIGAAYGYFLLEAQKDFEAAGCDIAREAVAHARDAFGLDVSFGDYLSLENNPPYDVVCLWDTIEHLRAPERYLEKASQQLRPGGTLALSTGDIGSFCARLRGRNWRLIHPPTHLHYFTRQSMTTLLQHLGFKNIQFGYHASWRTADAVAYLTLAHPPGRRTAPLYALLRKFGLVSFSFPMNTFDLMTVYAEKE